MNAAAHGVDRRRAWTSRTRSRPTRFYTLSVRQNYKNYTRSRLRQRLGSALRRSGGQPVSVTDPTGVSAIIQGVDLGRFNQRTNGGVFKGSFVDQVSKDRQFKVGARVPGAAHAVRLAGLPAVLRRHAPPAPPIVHRRTAYDPEVPRRADVPARSSAPRSRRRSSSGTTSRCAAGVRFEYFDARSTYPERPGEPGEQHRRRAAFAPRERQRQDHGRAAARRLVPDLEDRFAVLRVRALLPVARASGRSSRTPTTTASPTCRRPTTASP